MDGWQFKEQMAKARLMKHPGHCADGTKPRGYWLLLSHQCSGSMKVLNGSCVLHSVLGIQDEWDEDGCKWEGRALSWGTAKEFRQQSSCRAPRKGVERGLRQWVLSGVPLVPRREERNRGKVQISGGKESTYWSIAKEGLWSKNQLLTLQQKESNSGPSHIPAFPCQAPCPLIIPTPNFWGQLSCVSGMCGAAGHGHI